MTKYNWKYLLHFDMEGIAKMEMELQQQIPTWKSMTTSPRLIVILQKMLCYSIINVESIRNFMKHEQITVTTSHQNIIGTLAKELQEKINYCNSQTEKDHCILRNTAAISRIKNSFYTNCLELSSQLNFAEINHFMKVAAKNEERIEIWVEEFRNLRKQSRQPGYFLL